MGFLLRRKYLIYNWGKSPAVCPLQLVVVHRYGNEILLPAQVLAIMGRLIISITKGSIKTNKKRDKKNMSIYHEKIGGV